MIGHVETDLRSRTNEEWLLGLCNEEGPDQAVADLRVFLRNGLARALAPRGVGHADLDDFTQDAVIRVVEKIHTFRGDSRFTTWAMSVAIRVAFTRMRRRDWNNRPLEELGLDHVSSRSEGGGSAAPNPGRVAEKNDLLWALREAIDESLTERQRTVILAELAQVPIADIAEQLGTNPNALYKLCHDARKRLRQALEKAGFCAADVRMELEEGS